MRIYTLVFTVWLTACFASISAQAKPLTVGDTAPNWMLSNALGEPVLLYENADKGNISVMVFWATWCGKCKALLPRLQAITQQNQKVTVYALNVWEDKDPVDYFAEHQLQLTLLTKAEAVANRYHIVGTPSVIVIKPDRKITYMQHASDVLELESGPFAQALNLNPR